ncbi:MAG: 1-acyl-sn-glycerol-3-phosphate acyltransferase [Lachnospiraceae bacterium]|nr:1-acyl-sn-glycerol-3-phosphate acyltransferase [Lachnospiraceae bacterium]
MKIRVKESNIDEVLAHPGLKHREPCRQNGFLRALAAALSAGELKEVGFTCEKEGMERLKPDEPALFLMNHSSFLDLKIAAVLLKERPWHVVCTYDGFVGKEGLMRAMGCLPARKFITDLPLVQDMRSVTGKLRESVLLFPEASYSFDGTATPLPESLGKCIRMLRVPVVMIRTEGAFTRDPLYNGLRLRKVIVRARETVLFSPEEIASLPLTEINRRLTDAFTFDHFRWQRENRIRVDEPFRAEGLERVLYRCPVCGREGLMKGTGTDIACSGCGATWTLTEFGALAHTGGPRPAAEQAFDHIPDWYRWERACVRQEILDGTYAPDLPVRILVLADTKAVRHVGDGVLHHGRDGFVLTGCDGRLDYRQAPRASYSLYADYFWYELGDMISIGNLARQYYCFPKDQSFPVAKARLAAEELYKIEGSS